MFELKIIRHADISQQELDGIIRIKSAVWPYSYEKQIEWIDNNLKNSDLHLVFFKQQIAVAYLNLITIELTIDNSIYNAYGVGNVCALEKGKGYGTELLKQTNLYILKENNIGLLFCKLYLISFYTKCCWNVIEKTQLNLSFDNKEIETLIFNYTLSFNQLTFKGQPF
jgi:hypothetical protein